MLSSEVQNVIVLGTGGTGGALIPPLSRFLQAHPNFNGGLILVDGDSYEEGNADRQVFAETHVGQNKAEYQYSVICSHCPSFESQVSYIDEYLGKDDIESLITENTLVINCVDNLAARKYVEDRILELNNAIHICCGNEKRDGQVQAHVRVNGESITPSIYESYPELNSDNDDRSTLSCEQLAELEGGIQLITTNMMAAAVALNFVSICIGDNPMHQNGTYIPCNEVVFDTFFNSFNSVGVKALVL